MEIYVVGGSIRDLLLGQDPKDVDYVVINSSPAEMISSGFHQVGSDFPVYLHPITGEEYALGRTETKIGKGYHGFECRTEKVSLFQDLSRRDLTINALAVKLEDYETFKITKCKTLVIDFFDGIIHLEAGLLHHINECFSLDPVRILRTARFAARYGFDINRDTMELMKKIAPELNHVSQERIWTEFAKGLMEKYPYRMMNALEACGALYTDALIPYASYNEAALRQCTDDVPLEHRFVMIASGFQSEEYINMCIPNSCSKLNIAFQKVIPIFLNYNIQSTVSRMTFFQDTRAFNDSAIFEAVLSIVPFVCTDFKSEFVQDTINKIRRDLDALKELNVPELIKDLKNGEEIRRVVFDARCSILEKIREV